MKFSNILTRLLLAAACLLPAGTLSGQEVTGPFTQYPDRLEWMGQGDLLRIEPFGQDALRFRSTRSLRIADLDWNLIRPAATSCTITVGKDKAVIVNGNIKAEVSASGRVTYYNGEGKIILQEGRHHHDMYYDRKYVSRGSDHFELHVTFDADKDEKLYGMGQYPNDCLNLKGTTLELAQKNTQICVPFLISSKGYGFIWNNPSIGTAELSMTHTRFTARLARQIDYVVISKNTIPELVRTYTDLTGKSPEMPYYATGFWQSKLRYSSQEELLGIAKEYKKRNLPISVIIADFYHWPNTGDFKFDEKYWPDPAAMVKELKSMGIELVVSIWPSVSNTSENFNFMKNHNYLVNSEQGNSVMLDLQDRLTYVDVTNPKAREFMWSRLKANYFDKGVRLFWLDEAEPETEPLDYQNFRYYQGNGLEMSSIYPYCFEQAVYEGQKAAGQTDIINLARSGWIGSQRFGTLLWSGDINGDYDTFRKQIKAGLNISMCGFPWWNTDIGGFWGRPDNKDYRELLVRWFQYGAFCPVMRLHGSNSPHIPLEGQLVGTGQPNEVWSFGEEAYGILSRYLKIRESLRPYIYEQMKLASRTGDPMMRPMFYDFPEDEKAYEYELQYMFGPDLLVAPVVEAYATSWKVYLPAGAKWTDARTGKTYKGGQEVTLKVTLDDIPVFCKDGFKLNLKNY